MIETGPHVPSKHLAQGSRTLGGMFCARVALSRDRAAYYEKHHGEWQGVSWGEFYRRAACVAQGLVALGLEPGDRISILGPTTGRWVCLDMGAQLAGIVSVGLYPMQTVDQLRYLIDHCDSRLIFVDGAQELDNVLEAVRDNKKVIAIVPWSDELAASVRVRDPRVFPFNHFEKMPIDDAERDQRLAARDWDCLLYTSPSPRD